MKMLVRAIVSILVALLSYAVLHVIFFSPLFHLSFQVELYVPIIISFIIGLIFYVILGTFFTELIFKLLSKIEERLLKMNLKELAFALLGATIGLVVANLIGIAFRDFGMIGTVITVFLNIILCFLGIRVATRKKDELNVKGLQKMLIPILSQPTESKSVVYGCPKILDTSVIIDGRILDILGTGFIEGELIIPNFVLNELRHIADSSDDLKRNRGRRGLDILNEIQKQGNVPVHIRDFTTSEHMEVDAMLLKMAESMDAFVVTNDFNLNKVAEFQGVKILNINELANVIKPIVLPGEEMLVTIVKMGKEMGQGVAYLNDGTMIVVDGGNKFIGEDKNVVVTSVLQTAAGRMIFAKMI